MSDGRDGAQRLCHSQIHFFSKKQFVTFGRDLDFIARLEFAFEQVHRKRVEDSFLHGALERTRAELRAVIVPGVRFSSTSRRACG
jgi:hypothetical protein